MTPQRVRPAGDGDERSQLVGWFELQRAIVAWKCAGLSEADAHRSVLPTSPLMTMAGLLAHLRWTEHCWFEVLFLGRTESVNPQFGDDEDAEWKVDGVPLAQLLEEYQRQCAVSNEIIAAHSLDTFGKHPGYRAATLSLRWMVIHMIEETARHAGHADTIRELLDGTKGYY